MPAETIAYLAVSIDGYIAADDGAVAFLEEFGSDEYDFPGFLDGVGSLVMGAATYEQILGWGWPYGGLPAVVLTHRELPSAEGASVTFSAVSTGRAIRSLAADTTERVWIVGGGEVVTSGLEAGAIDVLELYVIPVALGSGVPLFTRDRNDIQLPPQGRKLLKHAQTMLTAWNRARQEIAVDSHDKTGLTAAGVPSLWDMMLPAWVEAMCRELPDIVLSVEALDVETILRRLAEGTLDLGLMLESPQMAEFALKGFATIRFVMVSSHAGLSSTSAVGGCPFPNSVRMGRAAASARIRIAATRRSMRSSCRVRMDRACSRAMRCR